MKDDNTKVGGHGAIKISTLTNKAQSDDGNEAHNGNIPAAMDMGAIDTAQDKNVCETQKSQHQAGTQPEEIERRLLVSVCQSDSS
jgi:hypothetical protein